MSENIRWLLFAPHATKSRCFRLVCGEWR